MKEVKKKVMNALSKNVAKYISKRSI